MNDSNGDPSIFSGHQPRILVVDDEQLLMEALCNTLSDHGYHTTGLTSAYDAVEIIKVETFDLLLTDLMMPEMDGIDLLKNALALDSDLIGIVMTGHGTIQTAVEALKSGAFDYVLKPIKLSDLLQVL